MRWRSIDKVIELQEAGDHEGLKAWIALGDEGRELYFRMDDEYKRTQKCGLCGQLQKDCYLACTQTY